MLLNTEGIVFGPGGLIPAIVQDERTGEVLMLAYMNERSLQKTMETGETWFYSRSREELWHKGAASGNRQRVVRMVLDCDRDTLLLEVEPLGPACHTGERTCFGSGSGSIRRTQRNIVRDVQNSIKERRANPSEGSYTSYLIREGIDKVCKKIGEEATEVVIGAKNGDRREIAMELADLVYHSLVLMEMTGVSIDDVKNVLLERSGGEGGSGE